MMIRLFSPEPNSSKILPKHLILECKSPYNNLRFDESKVWADGNMSKQRNK